MILIKIQCGCGHNYAFDVEPVGGRMPHSVSCPACSADGTAAAEQIIAQNLSPQPGAALASEPVKPLTLAPKPAMRLVPNAPLVGPRVSSAPKPNREKAETEAR